MDTALPHPHPGWRAYFRRAVFSGGHLLAFGGVFTLVVVLPDSWGPLTMVACAATILAADTLLVLFASLSPSFRRVLDDELAEQERAAVVARRRTLLSQMNELHRHQLNALESLVDAMRESPLARSAPVQPLVEACGDLIATFVHLAILHRRGRSCLDGVDRAQLREDIQTLERLVAGSTGAVREQAERRLALARRRAQLLESARERLGAIEQQLSIIDARIHLAHEEVRAPHAWDSTAHLCVAVPDPEELEAVRIEEEIDSAVLEMGRRAR